MVEVYIKKVRDNVELPKRMTDLSGGWDIEACRIIQESPNYVRVLTGLEMQPEKGYKIMLYARSNITKYNWYLANCVGLGDADYANEYELRFRAVPVIKTIQIGERLVDTVSYDNFPYLEGERVGQMTVEVVNELEFKEVDVLPNITNRTGGFDSTKNM